MVRDKNKIWYLSSCTTCKNIIKELQLENSNCEFVDIKVTPILVNELEEIQKNLNCSYEELFNKRALKFKEIKESVKTDEDFKKLIVEEYTFLKRPVINIGNKYFVGNSKGVVEDAKRALENFEE
ncbi:MAG: arsenate reductase family protein [Candidatus Woesearchaeota archaeon]